jgi:hypothetical protein
MKRDYARGDNSSVICVWRASSRVTYGCRMIQVSLLALLTHPLPPLILVAAMSRSISDANFSASDIPSSTLPLSLRCSLAISPLESHPPPALSLTLHPPPKHVADRHPLPSCSPRFHCRADCYIDHVSLSARFSSSFTGLCDVSLSPYLDATDPSSHEPRPNIKPLCTDITRSREVEDRECPSSLITIGRRCMQHRRETKR